MKRKTIRNHKDFFMPYGCFRSVKDCFVVKAKPARLDGDARYGLVVSKRNFKLAVQRNRAKRLVRDWLTFNEKLMQPDLDYVFILKSPVLDYDRKSGRRCVANSLKKIARLNKKNAKAEQ